MERQRLSEKFAAIYRDLTARGASDSAARFVAHIALAHGDRILFEATGIIDGEIAPVPRGSTASVTTRSSITRPTTSPWRK